MVSSQSLWSLMGLVCRSAELLGIHRDGELLGLGAVETEERRRLWWQIQHIDLIMAVKNGSTPSRFHAIGTANFLSILKTRKFPWMTPY